ncbi:MAG: type II toxin-antitoxin system VapC family toxin [Rhodocyclales bacterium]|nr:type II toxin-antitoxin system VapC family toxin [Rhodocyclales bacterium]
MILLDTHALYWLATADKKLGRACRARIEQALEDDGLSVSAISFWELEMLAKKKRIEADDIGEMRRIAIESGIVELPLDGPTAILAARLDNPHKDPADRFIAATAVRHRATLITADEQLLAGIDGLATQDARQ